jgi:hypothetical protein
MHMKDGDLRGIILEKFYEIRNDSDLVNVPELPEIVSVEPNLVRRVNICEQLGQYGLIKWVSTNSHSSIGGFGKITARGVDVVEGTASAPISVTLNDHNISIIQSSNVQIGHSNTINQTTGIDTDELTTFVAAIAPHLAELNLDPRQRQRAESQIATLQTELAGEPDPGIVSQALRTLRSITEGAIGSLLASAAQPGIWQWIHRFLQNF